MDIKEYLNKLAPPINPVNPSESSDRLFLDEDLSSEEEIEALRLAREAKHYKRVREEYSKKLREEPKYLSFTAEELFERYAAILNDDRQPFGTCMTPEFEIIVKRICCYFAMDTRGGLDLRKGLLLCGGIGIGKSTIMKFFRRNQLSSFKLIACRDVEEDFAIDGDEAMRMYKGNMKIATNSDPFGHQEIGYCFDDLGTEDISKHYGRIKNVMQSIIQGRYDMDLPFQTTHITTNLTGEQLNERYDARAIDRMRDMFNIVDFPVSEKSRRK